jgi:hypothetical protein
MLVVGLQKTRRVFREPQALIVKEGARIMSLLDGTSKVQCISSWRMSRVSRIMVKCPSVDLQSLVTALMVYGKHKSCKCSSPRVFYESIVPVTLLCMSDLRHADEQISRKRRKPYQPTR